MSNGPLFLWGVPKSSNGSRIFVQGAPNLLGGPYLEGYTGGKHPLDEGRRWHETLQLQIEDTLKRLIQICLMIVYFILQQLYIKRMDPYPRDPYNFQSVSVFQIPIVSIKVCGVRLRLTESR